jgi:hypothetical protein
MAAPINEVAAGAPPTHTSATLRSLQNIQRGLATVSNVGVWNATQGNSHVVS